MEEEIKLLKKQLRETKALCKTLEEKNLRLSNEVEVLRQEKGYISDPNEMSEEMLKIEMMRHIMAFQKFPAERRRIEEQKYRKALDELTPLFQKAMSLDREGNIAEAIKAHEACLEFGNAHKEILRDRDYEKSALRIAIIYQKTKQYEKEIEFIKKILNTRKKRKESLYSNELYRELEYRLGRVEQIVARKK